jgi:hypothetical protein
MVHYKQIIQETKITIITINIIRSNLSAGVECFKLNRYIEQSIIHDQGKLEKEWVVPIF